MKFILTFTWTPDAQKRDKGIALFKKSPKHICDPNIPATSAFKLFHPLEKQSHQLSKQSD
jgi:hypothetical protein